MNKVNLIGNLVKDPELKYTNSNIAVARYTIAINTRYGEKQETDYINVKTWGKSAEFINKYFKKGQPIAISGRLKNNNYEDNKGIKHYGIEVITEEIEFVGSKKEEAPHEEVQEEKTVYQDMVTLDESELPF